MIYVIGANVCETRSGIHLFDGGACLLEDGVAKVAIAEERITRQKYMGGFRYSIPYCLNAAGLSYNDIDLYVFSNCCDLPLDMDYLVRIIKGTDLPIPLDRVTICPSHHLSHAYSAYFASSFTEAIIVVADGEGNILGERIDEDHWGNRNERISYYLGKNNSIDLIERDADGIGEMGLGNGYDYATTWIGFPLYQHAGKTMALAAYGSPNAFQGARFFTYVDYRIKCQLEPIHTKSDLAVRRLIGRVTGYDIGVNKTTISPTKLQMDIARLVQDNLEQVLVDKVNYLVEKTGVTNLCLAGGVALNCVANSALRSRSKIHEIFVPPAAGDTGQCLGNALYGYHLLMKHNGKTQLGHTYLGREYSENEIGTSVSEYSNLTAMRPDDLYAVIAKHIAEGKIIGWFQGGSEFGPRALGNRSILADPRRSDMKKILNSKIKLRESYRPYASSVITERTSEFFDIATSPFMLLAANVYQDKQESIPSVVHVDGTSRLQTVDKATNPRFYDLITAFEKITGMPIILNTSFNLAGEPIVENPRDAIKCFIRSSMDILVIGDFVMTKNQ